MAVFQWHQVTVLILGKVCGHNSFLVEEAWEILVSGAQLSIWKHWYFPDCGCWHSRHDSSHWTTKHSLSSEFALFTLIWLECMVSINRPFYWVQDESCLLLACSNLNSSPVSRALLQKDHLCLLLSEFYVLS